MLTMNAKKNDGILQTGAPIKQWKMYLLDNIYWMPFVHPGKILKLRVECILILLIKFHSQQKFKWNQHKENINYQYDTDVKLDFDLVK